MIKGGFQMSMLEDLTKGGWTTALVGVGVAIVAPSVLPAIGSAMRPLAKAVVKGGVLVYDAVKEGVAEAGEQVNDLIAEARAEMNEPEMATTGAGTTATQSDSTRRDRETERKSLPARGKA
jgi:uncharacterized protein DUF5132